MPDSASDADPLGALREALMFERRLGGRLVPHIDTAPRLLPTHAFDAPGDEGDAWMGDAADVARARGAGVTTPGRDAPEGRLYVAPPPHTATATPPHVAPPLHTATATPTHGTPSPAAPPPATDPEPPAPATGDDRATTAPVLHTPRSVRRGDAYEPDDLDPLAFNPFGGDADDDDTDDDMPPTDLFGTPVPPADDPSASPYDRIEARIPDDSPVKDAETLAELLDIVSRTVFIPLDTQRIKPVFGTGPDDADLMIIGEAPGADEDRTGEPFVGRAGQLLTKILSAIGFERERVYITNILKSRPPGNRDPEPDEIAGHLPILLKQIVLVRPKVILCVGKTAGNSFLGRKSSLGALRDKEHSFEGLPLFVTYHPAALLRNEQWKRPTWEDVQMMRGRYDELGGR